MDLQNQASSNLKILKHIHHTLETVVITRGGSVGQRLRVSSGDCSLISPTTPTAS